jgi:hypothetical protein
MKNITPLTYKELKEVLISHIEYIDVFLLHGFDLGDNCWHGNIYAEIKLKDGSLILCENLSISFSVYSDNISEIEIYGFENIEQITKDGENIKEFEYSKLFPENNETEESKLLLIKHLERIGISF